MVTGGAGFIGCHLVKRLVRRYPEYLIVNVDALTYAGNLDNLTDIADAPNYVFVQADITDYTTMLDVMRRHSIDGIIHLAAESHVDRSISDPFIFAKTNVLGTLTLLQAAKEVWTASPEGFEGKRFHHVSTDEVYGALEADTDDMFTEHTSYSPHSPYSASKASSDHFVRAFHDTYGMPTVVTNCSNNYGPNQFPEKLIPLFINNIINRRPLPVYGRGLNVRDWLYVEDHVAALDLVFHDAAAGCTYNIGGFNQWRNIDLVKQLIAEVDRQLGRADGADFDLITYVKDRAGHDMRYAIDSTKISHDLGWKPSVTFEEGLKRTVAWYLANTDWLAKLAERSASDTSSVRGITVYGGSAEGRTPHYTEAAAAVGRAIAAAGVPLIYGGGRMGLMGAAGKACRAAGGTTVAVIPQFMVERGWNDPDASRTVVTPDMHVRKSTMASLAKGAIAMPGGIGTFEELTELITWRQLGLYSGNIVILNIDGYYDSMLATLSDAIAAGFMPADHSRLWAVTADADEAVRLALADTAPLHLHRKF